VTSSSASFIRGAFANGCTSTVVRADTGATVLVLVHEAREARWFHVREHGLIDDAILFEVRVAQVVVPLAGTAVAPQVGEALGPLPGRESASALP
jgi:hypothetical protein